MSLRLCQAILPLIKRFTNRDSEKVEEESKDRAGVENPKTPEELIGLLEKMQKDAQAVDFFKKIFQQDPVASENRFLNETMQNLQQRMASSEQRCELIQRINDNLADDLSSTLDELDALKRTVIDSHSDLIPAKQSKQHTEVVMPAYLRVMQAEQTLMQNFVYEEEELGAQTLASFHQRLRGATDEVIKPNQEESSEVDGENESSIPQESSIAGNVSFQN